MNTGSTTPETGAARFSRRVAWTIAAKVLIAASSLFSGVIVARWLGAAGVGVVASLAVITMIAINIGGIGLPSAITFLVARDKGKTKPILLNALVLGVTLGGLLALIIILVANARPGLLGDVPTTLLTIAAIALPAQLVSYLCLAVYLGMERIRAYNVIDLVLQAIVLLSSVTTLIILRLGLRELVTFGSAASILAALSIVIFLARTAASTGGTWRVDTVIMREMLRFGAKFFVAMVAGLVILRGDLLIVNYFRGSAEAGVYAVSTQAATLLQMIPAVVSTILFPRTAAVRDESGALTSRVTRHAVFIMFAICLAAAPLAFVLPLLYGPAFAAVPWQFLIMLPGVFLLGIETIQVQHFTGLGLTALIPVFWIVVMFVSVGLNVILVPKLGAYGAAISSTVSYTLIFVLVAAYFRTKTGRSIREAFLLRKGEITALFSGTLSRPGPREGKV